MFQVKKVNTFDGQDAQVFFKGKLIMQCTHIGESDSELIEQAKKCAGL